MSGVLRGRKGLGEEICRIDLPATPLDYKLASLDMVANLKETRLDVSIARGNAKGAVPATYLT